MIDNENPVAAGDELGFLFVVAASLGRSGSRDQNGNTAECNEERKDDRLHDFEPMLEHIAHALTLWRRVGG